MVSLRRLTPGEQHALRTCLELGFSSARIAAELDIAGDTLRREARRLDIRLPGPGRPYGSLRPPTPIDREVVRRRDRGETLQAIADDYGLTRERVRQLEHRARKRIARH